MARKKVNSSLGQNFLKDSYYSSRMVELIEAGEGDRVVEVGPGEGALTRWLIRRGVKLTVIEIDSKLAHLIREKYGEGVEVVEADVLEMDFCGMPFTGSLVVSNLPFYITSPFLYRMLNTVKPKGQLLKSCWKGAYITLQKEVVEKILLRDGEKPPTRISALLNMKFSVEPLLEIPPEAFHPRPSVSSVFVHFTPREAPLHPPGDYRVFSAFVKRIYREKRRKMKNTLKGFLSLTREGLEGVLGELSWVLDKRPEEVSLKTLAEVSERLHHRGEEQKIK